MGFIGWIVLGLIAGAIAKAILKDRAPGGFLGTLILGVVGAVVGGWLGSLIFNAPLEDFWSLQTWVLAIIGSVIVLWIVGALTGRRKV
ncbi:GlsB/YeaQ/YmgE family stress response membrane protein [Miniimonas arenae]|uniref:GlsB/YeaQ/YmgE family stress response membrane protein n=1 Tax=Miniimonas arenae TaxID=676201 RepID=A0A5C5B8V5_9MICO|nr:GlsB/YeaQ/YmgE family stress response membrane protein [Miniimonas arenae]TNU73131.1 GlsB/YeaQ/YmgE family stress response membrane protein [Miniimonas arenae]